MPSFSQLSVQQCRRSDCSSSLSKNDPKLFQPLIFGWLRFGLCFWTFFVSCESHRRKSEFFCDVSIDQLEIGKCLKCSQEKKENDRNEFRCKEIKCPNCTPQNQHGSNMLHLCKRKLILASHLGRAYICSSAI